MNEPILEYGLHQDLRDFAMCSTFHICYRHVVIR